VILCAHFAASVPLRTRAISLHCNLLNMLRLQMGRLLMFSFAVYYCTAAPTTDLVVPENLDFTAFSKLAPTDFLQAVIKSGGTEADCRSFATTTISTISESVKSQEKTWAAVDTGAGCASEGQEIVRVAQGKLQGKQGVLASKQGSAKAAREAKTVACTAAVDISVGLDTLTKTSCYDYATEASFISADAACNQAKTAVTEAAAAVDAAQTGVEDAQGEVDDAVAEAEADVSAAFTRSKPMPRVQYKRPLLQMLLTGSKLKRFSAHSTRLLPHALCHPARQ
jgi:hypothetical protein